MSFDQETCFVCGKAIPYDDQPSAVYHASLRIRYCLSEACKAVVHDAVKDRSASARGRLRSRKSAIAIIAANGRKLAATK